MIFFAYTLKQACNDKLPGEYSTIKFAEAILKIKDSRMKNFDGNVKNYPAFKA